MIETTLSCTGSLGLVQVLDELGDAALVLEDLAAAALRARRRA